MATTLANQRARKAQGPLTTNQLGAIHREFYRLGFHIKADRAERLRLTAILAESEPISSTKELTTGQAGRAVGLLTGCRTTRDLYALAEPEPRGLLAALWARLTGR
jgi:hypothetical protein